MIPRNALRNIRYGLATNSSSSHSIIHNVDEATMDEYETVSHDFGWEFFTAYTKADREAYMIEQLRSNLPSGMHAVCDFMMQYEGVHDRKTENGYVDHDSVMALPKDMYGESINMDFFREYYDYITNNYFVIIGGNDNTDEEHRLSGTGDEKTSYMWSFRSDDIAYKNNNYWVVLNKNRKMRINFEGQEPIAKFPELIDLKITDYCDMGCSFCYQGSTEDGMHASLDIVKKIIDSQPYGASIEFAIGGGEPTTHPEFPEILRKVGQSRHIANFTTKSTKWMEDDTILEAVKKYVSGVAYSPNNAEDAVRFVLEHDKHVGSSVAIYLHIIPEIWSNEELNKLLGAVEDMNRWNTKLRESCNFGDVHITMLGYKTTGRGSSREVSKKDGLVDYIKSFRTTQVGVDTKIVNDYRDELALANIDKLLFTAKEGEFSMYIDAVAEKAYKSSYELDNPVDIVENRYGNENQYIQMERIQKLFESIK